MEDGNKIKTHYSDEEILKITLNQELDDWERQLDFVGKELIFLADLLDSHTKTEVQKGKKHIEEKADQLRQSIQDFIKKNKQAYDETLSFSNKTMGIRECEDMDCEAYFFNEHFDFHKKLKNHLDKARNLKMDVFNFLQKDKD